MSRGLDDIWMEAMRLSGESRERRLRELCGDDAGLLARVRELLPAEDEAVAPPLEPPCRLGPYTLLERIAGGAHGDVYRATRADLEGQVALKVLRRLPGAPELIETVRREASSARRVSSEHVVAVHGAGRIDEGPYYIEMALAADSDPERPGAIRLGTSLRHVAAGPSGPQLSPVEAARLVEAVCRGVEAAHRAGVVHGDIKPENVLVTPVSRRVMLADFGIATTLARYDDAFSPNGRVRAGTLAYMAPEQYESGRTPDERSDVYMLGGTLHFALSGEVPHPERTPGSAADAPRARVPRRVPERLAEIVERALDPDPACRYRSAGAMADDLRRFRELRPTSAEERRPLRRATLFARRNASVLAALAGALAVSAALAFAGWRVLNAAVVAREARVRDLEAQRTALVADGEKLQAKNAALMHTRAELEAQVADLGRRIQAARHDLEDLPRLRAALEQSRTTLDAQDRSLAAQTQAVADARARLDAVDAARRQAEERAGRTGGELAAAQKSVDELRSELADARDRLERALRAEGERDALRARADALQARVDALQRELGASGEKHDAVAKTADELRARLREAEKKRAAQPASKSGGAAAQPVPARAAAPASSQ